MELTSTNAPSRASSKSGRASSMRPRRAQSSGSPCGRTLDCSHRLATATDVYGWRHGTSRHRFPSCDLRELLRYLRRSDRHSRLKPPHYHRYRPQDSLREGWLPVRTVRSRIRGRAYAYRAAAGSRSESRLRLGSRRLRNALFGGSLDDHGRSGGDTPLAATQEDRHDRRRSVTQ
jgi:hypothetical protein